MLSRNDLEDLIHEHVSEVLNSTSEDLVMYAQHIAQNMLEAYSADRGETLAEKDAMFQELMDQSLLLPELMRIRAVNAAHAVAMQSIIVGIRIATKGLLSV